MYIKVFQNFDHDVFKKAKTIITVSTNRHNFFVSNEPRIIISVSLTLNYASSLHCGVSAKCVTKTAS